MIKTLNSYGSGMRYGMAKTEKSFFMIFA